MNEIKYHYTGKQRQAQSDLLVPCSEIDSRTMPLAIGILALTHNTPSHILKSPKSDFYHDLEALKTTHNFVILWSSSNHFGIPKGIYKTAKLRMHSKVR